MDLYTAQAQQEIHGSGWKAVFKVIVVAVGLVLGAMLGLVGALYFGLIEFVC
jgi:hypothetical protein